MKRGKVFQKSTPVDDALEEFSNRFDVVGSETVRAEDAVGRVAGSTVEAENPVPKNDRAALDGYAVRAEDTYGASRGSPATVETTRGDVDEGEASYVSAREIVPEGADAVVRVDDTVEVGGSVEVSRTVSRGENVLAVGEDVNEGEKTVEEGDYLRPSRLGVLRSVGVEDIDVRRKPEVGVVSVEESVTEAVGTKEAIVAEYVERWGGSHGFTHGISDSEDIRNAVGERATEGDILAIVGGSVGEKDPVPEVIDELGEVVFHGVSIKPGHTVGFGIVDGTPVVILPEYPVSCVVASFVFLRRGIRELLGANEKPEPTVLCRLSRKIGSELGARTYTRVEVKERGSRRLARPIRTKGAGVLSSVAESDGFVVTPENREGHAEGDEVDVLLWRA